MKVIVTGANGFLGSAIVKAFADEIVITLGRSNSDINVFLDTSVPELPNADLIVHAAGKAHVVPQTQTEANEFFKVNLTGTLNLLRGLERCSSLPRGFVFISSVAVYGLDSADLADEQTRLSASDPYGKSKVEAEYEVSKWCSERGVTCMILRLPLLAGPNPPGNLGAMINALRKGYYFNIGGGHAKKSIVLTEDVAAIIRKSWQVGGIYNLTDGVHPDFNKLSEVIAHKLNKGKPANLPAWAAKLLAVIGDIAGKKSPINSRKLSKMTATLTFDDQKARKELGWSPRAVTDHLII